MIFGHFSSRFYQIHLGKMNPKRGHGKKGEEQVSSLGMEEGWVNGLRSLTHKKSTRISDFQSDEAPPNLFDYHFYKLKCPWVITLNSCPEDCRRGAVMQKDIISGPFNKAEKKNYFKFRLDTSRKMMTVGGGTGFPPITFDYQKGLSISNWLSPFQSFCHNYLYYL